MRNPPAHRAGTGAAASPPGRAAGGDAAAIAARLQAAAALARSGAAAQAEPLVRAVLLQQPRHFEALQLLGMLLAGQGRLEEAIESLRQACAVAPRLAPAHSNLGLALNMAGRHEQAVEALERAIALDPANPLAHNNLGTAWQSLERHERALRCFQAALRRKPDYVEALSNLGGALHLLQRDEEALAPLQRALALAPRFASAHLNLGAALQGLERRTEARASLDRALALEPGNPLVLGQLAAWQTEAGQFEEAARSYAQALAARPGDARLLHGAVQLGRVTKESPQLAALEALAARETDIPEVQRIPLHFALGKAYADLHENERAFEHLQQGNALKRRQIEYDETGELGLFERIRDVFSGELLASRAGQGHPSERPVFIVGMMRSGTTLIEQLLAAHPAVRGGGERRDLTQAYAQVRGTPPPEAPRYPEAVAPLSPEELQRVGAAYLARTDALAAGAAPLRVTDKMPGNFSALGLIRLALPNARIIHARRDPVDTCLSCYSKLFTDGQPHTYDLAELGRYYRAYDALMAHWRALLPPAALLEVRYEELVADFEGQARRIVAFCGLPWDDACLRFYEVERPVTTASQVQVRQPVYRSSVGRWRPDAPTLQPLLDGLGAAAGGTA